MTGVHMTGPDMTYQIEGLRAGVDGHGSVAGVCTVVAEMLAGHGVAAGMLGSVPAAGRFHAVLDHVWNRQAADAGVEAARRRELAERSGRTADLGADLVTDTTAAARGVRYGPTAG
jgi:hypothetical protein